MITFELSEEQKIAQSTIREFTQSVLRPVARQADDARRFDQNALDAIWSTEVVQAQGSDEGRSPILNAILLEEFAAADAAFAVAVAAPMAFIQAIADQGSAKQRETLLAEFTGK
ncbi:MAG TPA: acyl-CoA dehydrogenase family protein, partial [Steroidobacteraceae bacterium]